LKTVPDTVLDWANAEQTDNSKTILAYSFDNELLMMLINFGERIGFSGKNRRQLVIDFSLEMYAQNQQLVSAGARSTA
jgi:hypothetical protein